MLALQRKIEERAAERRSRPTVSQPVSAPRPARSKRWVSSGRCGGAGAAGRSGMRARGGWGAAPACADLSEGASAGAPGGAALAGAAAEPRAPAAGAAAEGLGRRARAPPGGHLSPRGRAPDPANPAPIKRAASGVRLLFLRRAPSPPLLPVTRPHPPRTGSPDKMQDAQLLRGTNALKKVSAFYLQFKCIWLSCILYARSGHPCLDPSPSLGPSARH